MGEQRREFSKEFKREARPVNLIAVDGEDVHRSQGVQISPLMNPLQMPVSSRIIPIQPEAPS